MVLNIIILLIIAAIIYLVFKVIKRSPSVIMKASLVLFIIGVIVIELGLRLSGGRPYFIVATPPGGVSQVPDIDNLISERLMLCDSFGVNKMDPFTRYISENPFARKHSGPLLNRDGFRSLYEFSKSAIDSIHGRGRKAIFLIGDSYTYGLNADSGFSFASLLETYGKYGILNAGIPGTDAPQYSAVVHEYIATGKIKPDEVVVCFSHNDLMHFPDRKLTPGTPLLFQTNVGSLYSFQGLPGEDTVYRTAKAAYQNIISRYTIKGVIGEGWYTDLVGKSVLASRFIGLFKKRQGIVNDTIKKSVELDPVNSHIKAIKRDCEKVGIPVIFVILPDKEFVKEKVAASYDCVISLDPKLFSMDDFTSGLDNHPNNIGHKKIAIEIDKLLSKN